MSEELGLGQAASADNAHLLVSIVSLCWFPLVHGATLLRSIGLDASAPEFGEARKRQIVDLLLHGVAGRLGPDLRRASPALPGPEVSP
jgi:hypothetical protein